jgi:hypothetical protein
MKWTKLGRIIEPKLGLKWMKSHIMVPTAEHIEGDIFRIYYSGRDELNRSLIGSVHINITEPHKILDISHEPVLGLGELGCFDDNGVTPSWIINSDGNKYLYYIGWRPRSTTRMSVIAGLAMSNDDGQTFRRVSRAPILRITNDEPFAILTAPCVMIEDGIWKMWYVSGVEWVNPELPRYNIKYAVSNDGIEWNQTGIVCIDNDGKSETALARPCVLNENGIFKMWYSYKKQPRDYRIGYAESKDGLAWTRMDEMMDMDVSESGWDSEMIEYSFVFNHNKQKYMLYNGNGYGMSGAGLAIMVE